MPIEKSTDSGANKPYSCSTATVRADDSAKKELDVHSSAKDARSADRSSLSKGILKKRPATDQAPQGSSPAVKKIRFESPCVSDQTSNGRVANSSGNASRTSEERVARPERGNEQVGIHVSKTKDVQASPTNVMSSNDTKISQVEADVSQQRGESSGLQSTTASNTGHVVDLTENEIHEPARKKPQPSTPVRPEHDPHILQPIQILRDKCWQLDTRLARTHDTQGKAMKEMRAQLERRRATQTRHEVTINLLEETIKSHGETINDLQRKLRHEQQITSGLTKSHWELKHSFDTLEKKRQEDLEKMFEEVRRTSRREVEDHKQALASQLVASQNETLAILRSEIAEAASPSVKDFEDHKNSIEDHLASSQKDVLVQLATIRSEVAEAASRSAKELLEDHKQSIESQLLGSQKDTAESLAAIHQKVSEASSMSAKELEHHKQTIESQLASNEKNVSEQLATLHQEVSKASSTSAKELEDHKQTIESQLAENQKHTLKHLAEILEASSASAEECDVDHNNQTKSPVSENCAIKSDHANTCSSLWKGDTKATEPAQIIFDMESLEDRVATLEIKKRAEQQHRETVAKDIPSLKNMLEALTKSVSKQESRITAVNKLLEVRTSALVTEVNASMARHIEELHKGDTCTLAAGITAEVNEKMARHIEELQKGDATLAAHITAEVNGNMEKRMEKLSRDMLQGCYDRSEGTKRFLNDQLGKRWTKFQQLAMTTHTRNGIQATPGLQLASLPPHLQYSILQCNQQAQQRNQQHQLPMQQPSNQQPHQTALPQNPRSQAVMQLPLSPTSPHQPLSPQTQQQPQSPIQFPLSPTSPQQPPNPPAPRRGSFPLTHQTQPADQFVLVPFTYLQQLESNHITIGSPPQHAAVPALQQQQQHITVPQRTITLQAAPNPTPNHAPGTMGPPARPPQRMAGSG
ncbi:hypothetical protein BDV95DRAFT_605641 [Massariosphaeria phaeospora]|uniref:Uncharacterized protein n=1 Tax=Massariosphaeria phaeospora TaxID=100035 RepID=A0A7C8ICY4_9PLEO|nr:hypothetical protein BDV95DRAFT_605641 [Massariosphaeria phaeospora]